MKAEKIDIPEELKILNPETQKKPIVIGSEAYMVYPLTEGQAERVSELISNIITDITTLDVKCPNCDHVYPGMLGKQDTCTKCKKKGKGKHALKSMQKPPVVALTFEDRIPKLIEGLIGIPLDSVKEDLTINQFKHIAGVLYEQNFKEEGGGLPRDSAKNFNALLDWIGLGAQKNEELVKEALKDLEKSTSHSQASTDSPENTSKEDGSSKAQEEEKDS